jgi:hypothetical protein
MNPATNRRHIDDLGEVGDRRRLKRRGLTLLAGDEEAGVAQLPVGPGNVGVLAPDVVELVDLGP